MHLRLPLVIGVVAVASVAAILRPHGAHSLAPPGSALSPPVSVASRGPFDRVVSERDLGLSRHSATRDSRGAHRAERSSSAIVVYVAGRVARPGLYHLPPHSRADDALRAAGGAQSDADLVALNLAAPLADGDEVAVLSKTEASLRPHRRTRRGTSNALASGGVSEPPRKKRAHRKRRAHADASIEAATNDLVDLNAADASELETLPGIGAALAERIVTVREASGPFGSADDLLDVGGMTQGRLDALLPYVVVR